MDNVDKYYICPAYQKKHLLLLQLDETWECQECECHAAFIKCDEIGSYICEDCCEDCFSELEKEGKDNG